MKVSGVRSILNLVRLYLCTWLVFSPGVTWARVFYSSSSSEVSVPKSTDLPTGGSFSSGIGSISTDEASHYMTVTQSSTKGTVKWDSFNKGLGF